MVHGVTITPYESIAYGAWQTGEMFRVQEALDVFAS